MNIIDYIPYAVLVAGAALTVMKVLKAHKLAQGRAFDVAYAIIEGLYRVAVPGSPPNEFPVKREAVLAAGAQVAKRHIKDPVKIEKAVAKVEKVADVVNTSTKGHNMNTPEGRKQAALEVAKTLGAKYLNK